MTDDRDEGEMPPRFPDGASWANTLSYVRHYQDLNQDRHLTGWQFETLGQRRAREQKEQAK